MPVIRLPLNKIYRAFPELDQFTDEQCERYVALSRRELGCAYFLLPPIGVIVLFALAIYSVWIAMSTFAPRLLADRVMLATIVVIVWVVGIPILGGLVIRDLLLHTMLRRHVRSRIERSRCPACKYSLLGQRVAEGIVRCPECGNSTTLATLGLMSEAELIPQGADISHSKAAQE